MSENPNIQNGLMRLTRSDGYDVWIRPGFIHSMTGCAGGYTMIVCTEGTRYKVIEPCKQVLELMTEARAFGNRRTVEAKPEAVNAAVAPPVLKVVQSDSERELEELGLEKI